MSDDKVIIVGDNVIPIKPSTIKYDIGPVTPSMEIWTIEMEGRDTVSLVRYELFRKLRRTLVDLRVKMRKEHSLDSHNCKCEDCTCDIDDFTGR